MNTVEERYHEELSKEFDAKVIIIEDQETINNWLASKSFPCWNAGRVISNGWVELATFSPRHKGDSQTIFICSEEKAKIDHA